MVAAIQQLRRLLASSVVANRLGPLKTFAKLARRKGVPGYVISGSRLREFYDEGRSPTLDRLRPNNLFPSRLSSSIAANSQ
jgi:hypothetical protein